MPIPPFRMYHSLILTLALAACQLLFGGEAYYTGFESFTVGGDTIAGTDSWVGSHAGMKLNGVMSEAQHGVVGIGNAAFIGGYATTSSTSINKVVNVRRPVNLNPVTLNQEVVTFSVVFGIKDSSSASLITGSSPARYKRDNFEFLIYNQAGMLLAGVQFDNSTLDSTTSKPRRLIYRLAWNASTSAYQYVLTGYNFLSETLETLQFRINYRTNLWTATLSDVPIFQDIPFYTGTATKDLGFVLAKMAVTNTASVTGYILPGDNYMLFDDYTVRTDALTTALTMSKSAKAAAKLTWNEEAGYTYQAQYSSDCNTWFSNLTGASHTASLTGSSSFTDPTTTVPSKRFYRVKRSYP
jgi:hypothetical protein